MSNAPAGILYSKSHEWARLEGDQAVIGITAFAQESLGDITYVELPQAGDTLAADKEFGSVESVKAASDLISPVDGEVLEVNTALEDALFLANHCSAVHLIHRREQFRGSQILAEAVSGSIPEVVELMNRRARELGCQSTHFMNAHGFDEEGHYTTARDIYIFSKEAFRHEIFRTVVYTSVHKVPATNKSKEREMYNSNALVSQWRYPGYRFDKVIGGKTGSTGDAGYCLMAAAEDGDEYLISVVLGAETIMDDRGYVLDRKQFSESRRLLVWGFKSFRRVTLSQDGKPVTSMPVTLSQQTDTVMLQPQGSITRTLPVDLDEEHLERDIALFYESVQAPVEEGQVLGTMTISYEGDVLGTMDLVACTSVERSEFLYQKERIEQFFKKSGTQIVLGSVILLAGIVCLRLLVFRKLRRPYSAAGAKKTGSQKRNDNRW